MRDFVGKKIICFLNRLYWLLISQPGVLGVALGKVGWVSRVGTEANESELVEVILALMRASHLPAFIQDIGHLNRVKAHLKLSKQFPIAVFESRGDFVPEMFRLILCDEPDNPIVKGVIMKNSICKIRRW